MLSNSITIENEARVEALRAGFSGQDFVKVAEHLRELAAEAAILFKGIYAAIHALDGN